jgi:integrase
VNTIYSGDELASAIIPPPGAVAELNGVIVSGSTPPIIVIGIDPSDTSPADIHLFLEMARPTQYYALFYMALFTGMRRSELLALRWQDIDLLFLQVSVTRSLHQVKGGQIVIRQPKTEKSRRLVSLPISTAPMLERYRESQNKERASLGYNPLQESDYVFCHYNGKPLLPNTVTHNWIKLARRTGLKDIRFHDARHTHASLMLKQGVHPKIVQERLGHSSIQLTLDTYSHVAPGMQQAAAQKFDEIICPINSVN